MKTKILTTIGIAGLLSTSVFAADVFAQTVQRDDGTSRSARTTTEDSMIDLDDQRTDRERVGDRASLGRDSMSDQREARNDAQMILRKSADIYRAIAKGPHGGVPESVTSKANCIAVVPNVVTAAVVVGGSHGDGVASCKLSSGQWSQPAFVNLTSGSLGAQVGAKSTDAVLYFTTPSAANALKTGKFAIGADASVVAGNFERSFDTSGAGVVAYQRTSGAFLGASLNGGSIGGDDNQNRAYYGKDVEIRDILEGRAQPMAGATDNQFTQLLPK